MRASERTQWLSSSVGASGVGMAGLVSVRVGDGVGGRLRVGHGVGVRVRVAVGLRLR